MARAAAAERHRPVVHFELHTGDRLTALDFYARIAGWQAELIECRAGSYWALELGCEFGGGVVECRTPSPLWLPYLEVASVDEATARAGELGARIILAPRDGPSGRRSVVSGPASGEVALWQPRRPRHDQDCIARGTDSVA